MTARLQRISPWVSISGVLLLLIGLGWDAALHRIDPDLAAREGVFNLSNPGHVLFASGIGLTVLGVLGRLAVRLLLSTGRQRLAWGGAGGGLLALSGVSFALAVSSGSSLSGAHQHPSTASAGAQHVDDHSHTDAGASVTAAKPNEHSHPNGVEAASGVKAGVSHDHGIAANVTLDELHAATKLAEDTRAGTARFQDFAVAQAEGYKAITNGRWIAHYHNEPYNRDGRVLDPERPEELIYATTTSGEKKLVGVMYLMPQGQTGPKVGGVLTAWHAHDNLCFRAGVVVALQSSTNACPAGTYNPGKTPEMLHVWLVDNPSGVFSDDMNPALLRDIVLSKSQ